MRFRTFALASVVTGLALVCTGTISAQAVALEQGQSDSNARVRGVSLKLHNVPISEAIGRLAAQAGMKVLYNKADGTLPKGLVKVDISDTPVNEALALITKGTGVTARISPDGESILVRVEGVVARNAVQGVIVGKVTDSKTGKGIIGATISLGNDAGKVTISADDGSYRLVNVPGGAQTVTARLVGYAKQTRSVTVGEGATITVDFRLEPSTSVLDQVIVTGTVVATELKAVPSAITVVTAKQIEERGITRIDQLFRGDIPGLFAVNRGSTSALDDVIMFSRGATALTQTSTGTSSDPGTGGWFPTNTIKTYVDGIEMADSKYLNQIDPSSIERIEILTGPQASTIYGSNAINGVMQIFTKRGATTKPRITLNLTSGVAQNKFSNRLAPSHLADGTVAGTEGRLSYQVGGSWDYIGAWTPSKRTERGGVNGGGRMELGKLSLDASARRTITKNRQEGGLSEESTALRTAGVYTPSGTGGATLPVTAVLDGRTTSFTAGYRFVPWWSHELILGSDVYVSDRIESPSYAGIVVNDTLFALSKSTAGRTSQRYTSTVKVPMFEMAHLDLTLGADHWRTKGQVWTANPLSPTGSLSNVTNLIINKPAKNTGAFIQGQLSLKDALFFTYGVRADWNPTFGDDAKVRPGRYGVSYTFNVSDVSAKLRASYGRSIRPPAEDIKGGSILRGALGVANFGNVASTLANPDLVPEHQQGGEGGIELYFSSRGSLVVTRYNQTVDNLISSVRGVDSARSITNTPATNSCSSDFRDANGACYFYQSQYLNVGSIRNQGWELQGNVNTGAFTTRGTYSWNKSRVLGITPRYSALLTGSQFEPGRPFDFIPEHTWALGVTYAHTATNVSLFINGTGALYSGGNDVSLLTTSNNRLTNTRLRMSVPSVYRTLTPGYAKADINASHRFTSRTEALLNVQNLTDYYHNDYNPSFPTMGRQTKVGLRIRM